MAPHVVEIETGILLKLSAIRVLDALAILGWVLGGHLGGVRGDGKDDAEGAEEKHNDDEERNSLAAHVVTVGEVAILPNDIGWLGGVFEAEILSEEQVA